jgi:hypothetical protein
MDDDELSQIEDWYNQEKDRIEKRYVEIATVKLDEKAKERYKLEMKKLRDKYEQKCTKAINRKHTAKTIVKDVANKMTKSMDKFSDIYKE